MMPAAKHGDPQIGVDIHLCIVPPSPSPVPLPTPHTSVVFDPFDYVPILGATVTVCGMKRATAGTSATAIHIPPGFPFAPKLPDKDDEIFMGSSTVVTDGDPFSFTSVPTLSCQIAGMISPPRPKKKGSPKAMLLPTTVNLAIPTNVFVGGPPTISLLGMAFKLGLSALGRFARSGLFRRIRQRLFRNLNPGFLKCVILRAEPVNILSGEVSVEHEDFTLPGRIPIEWKRTYTSGTHREGLCGFGWETPADIRLEVDRSNGSVSMAQPTAGPLFFDRLPAAQGADAAELELMDGALLSDHGETYKVRTKEDRVYSFPKALAQVNRDGDTEYPIGRIADLCGNWLDFERYSGRLVGMRESAGRYLGMTIENGRIRQIDLQMPGQDQQHVFVKYQYDGKGDLVAVLDPYDHPYTFAYKSHHMVRHTDRNGLSFYYEYDQPVQNDWRVVHAWGDGGLYDYTFEYFDELNERRITDSLGHTSTVKLNEAGLPISEIDPLGGMTIFEYDDAGRTTAVVDQDQHRTEYAYDTHGNLLKIIRPDGNSIETEFNDANKAVKITDPNGEVWLQEWDTRGLLIRQETPLGAVSICEYDSRGQLINLTNPKGARTILSFDGYSNLTCLTNALGHATTYAYDILGNVINKTDPLGQRTSYAYDAKGRLRKAMLPNHATIACTYDPEDNLIRYVDENGAETKLEYCGLGEIKRRLQPDGHSVQYHYDTEERLVGVTNQRGERYQLIHDPMGRIVKEVDYWGQSRRYKYSAAGFLRQSADPQGRIIQYQTDQLGRITQKLLPDPFYSDQVQIESFEYDATGNLTACENDAIRVEREFDAEGRLLVERQGEKATIAYTYDQSGNRLTRTFNIKIEECNDTNTVQYEYDLLDKVVGVIVVNHYSFRFDRNALGQVTEERLNNNVRRDLSYSSDGYLVAQRVLVNETPMFEQRYRYDTAGNLIEKHDSALGVDRFSYDPLGRLVSHLNPDGWLKNYLNDPAGDRLRTRTTQQTPYGDGYAQWRRDGEYEGIYYRFDRAGNLVERRSDDIETRFRWNANQRLVESASNDIRTKYQYDPLGRRISKMTDGAATCFFWDGDALLSDFVNGKKDNFETEPSRLREWVYYPGTSQPMAMIWKLDVSESELYIYHNDPNGCPTRMLDGTGSVVWAAQYSAWGGIDQMFVNRVDNPIRLQGQYWDGETLLSYNRYRYYDSNVGTFINMDPLGLEAGIHIYQYASNIFGWIDPLGLNCEAARRAANEISDEFKKKFMCKQFAEELEQKLRAQGIHGTRLDMRTGTGRIFSDSNGVISETGEHVAIRVENKVFDNLHPEGINYSDWIEDLGGKTYTEPPFARITETAF